MRSLAWFDPARVLLFFSFGVSGVWPCAPGDFNGNSNFNENSNIEGNDTICDIQMT